MALMRFRKQCLRGWLLTFATLLAATLIVACSLSSNQVGVTPTSPTVSLKSSADKAKELAISLSGDTAVDCSESDQGFRFVLYPMQVNECVVTAIETKQPFRMFQAQSRSDTIDNYWFVGTPAGEVFVLIYTDSAMSSLEYSEIGQESCKTPSIVTYDNKLILECQREQ